MHNDRLIGIARTELLAVLQRHAEKAGRAAGVRRRCAAGDLDADIVIAADGISSGTREDGDSAPPSRSGAGCTCGAGPTSPSTTPCSARRDRVRHVRHARLPVLPGQSTFLIETDEATWRAAGFDITRRRRRDASDPISLAHLQQAFAGPLRGHALIGNRTRWTRFRTVRCQRWSDGRTVLLGDAAHTAHFSIGSGTKLAMEDAIALVGALGAEPDAATAFARYEAVRRPAVERLQGLARRSSCGGSRSPRARTCRSRG